MAKIKYCIEIIEQFYGKRIVHDRIYVSAYSTAQAIMLATRNKDIPDNYSINCERVA